MRVGDCVLKPVDNPARYRWECERLQQLPGDGFRIARPLQTAEGAFVVQGWGAAAYEPGSPIAGRWAEKLQVSQRFHKELNKQQPPPMPPSDDAWTQAHEMAWLAAPLPAALHPDTRQRMGDLFNLFKALPREDQVIHADLSGNILFHDKLAPCVIDFSPAYGSAAYAEAILLADAVAWEGAPLEILELVRYTEGFRQHLLRAVSFRLMVPAIRASPDPGPFRREYAAFRPLIEFIRAPVDG